MKFILVNPYLSLGPRSRQRQPLSMAIIANVLRKYDHEVSLVDCSVRRDNHIDFDKKYDYLIITSSPVDRWETPFLDYSGMIEVINNAHKNGIESIVVGPHGTVCGEKVIKEAINFLKWTVDEMQFYYDSLTHAPVEGG